MSPYRYRCGQCRATSPPTITQAEAEAHRDHHRASVHGGLAPDGEDIETVRGDAARNPDTRYLSTRAALIGIGLLALASLISRVLDR
ncbi:MULTISPECIES: hypothetical protein [unclassified Streptomyces]|uniref:hypothetical protein n=1 Tax=unclassified Streptomyces TaxID=2593676 RepID=UPI00081E6005|nr:MULTISPECIES: hypothetical protein [unclassified Streptomyces]MYZ35851.1 hypothetical protein [Streptomyces sp. SID4917]SCF78843.1 hypothetical protein GA0115259_102556 [Streptomyces sp. MnatMP-M17]